VLIRLRITTARQVVESSARFGTLLSVFYLPTSALDVQCSMFGVCFYPEP